MSRQSRLALIEGEKLCKSCGETKPSISGFAYGQGKCKLCVKCIRGGIPLDQQRLRQASDRVSLLPEGVVRDNLYPHKERMEIEVLGKVELPKIDESEEKIAKLTEELNKREKAMQQLQEELEAERIMRVKQNEALESALKSTMTEKQSALEQEAFLRERIILLQSDLLKYQSKRKQLKRELGKETEEDKEVLDRQTDDIQKQIRRLKHKHSELIIKQQSKPKKK